MKLPKKEKILKCGVQRRKNHLYFINKEGNVGEVPMKRGKHKGKKPQSKVILKTDLVKEKGYLYFLDEDGDIGRIISDRGSVTIKDRKVLKERKKKILAKARERNKRENRYLD